VLGLPGADGTDSYVLGEINVSSVFPIPGEGCIVPVVAATHLRYDVRSVGRSHRLLKFEHEYGRRGRLDRRQVALAHSWRWLESAQVPSSYCRARCFLADEDAGTKYRRADLSGATQTG
jgi:hypothetical protein